MAIKVSASEVIALAQKLRRLNEESMTAIKRDLEARNVQNDHMSTEKERREAVIYNYIITQLGRAGLTGLLSSFVDSYNLRAENRGILNKARHLEGNIPSSMTDRFVARLNQRGGALVERADVRFRVGGDQWGQVGNQTSTIRRRYRHAETMIENVRDGVQRHRDVLQGFRKSGTTRHTISNTGTASRAFLSRIDHVTDYAVEALVGLGTRAGEADGIVSAVRNVLDVSIRNVEIAQSKGAELADQTEAFANDMRQSDQQARRGFRNGVAVEHQAMLQRSQVELAIYRPDLLEEGEGLEKVRSDQQEERYETLKEMLRSVMFEVADFIARPTNYFVPNMVFLCEQGLEGIASWESFINRAVTFETRQSSAQAMEALEHPQQARNGIPRPWGHESGSLGWLADYIPSEVIEAITTAKTTLEAWKEAFERTMSTAGTLATAIDQNTHMSDLSERVLRGIYAEMAFDRLQSVGTRTRERLEAQARIFNQFANLIRRNMSGGGVRGCTDSLDEGARYFRAVAQAMETDFGSGGLAENVVNHTTGFDVRRQRPNAVEALQVNFGLTLDQIQFAAELGYTPEELVALFRSFETEADATFFSHLLGGNVDSFTEAFMINPWILSPEMTIFMSDFATRLFENDPERFEVFVNTLIGMEGLIQPILPENSIMLNATVYRDEFLTRLFVGTYSTLEYQAFLLGLGIGDETNRARLETQMALSGFWASLSVITAELQPWRQFQPLNLSVNNISLNDDGSLYFYLNYTIGEQRNNISVTNFMSATGALAEGSVAARRLAELRREQEQFSSNLFRNILSGASTVALTIAFPKLGLAVGAVNLLSSQGRSGSLTGINAFLEGDELRNVRSGVTAGNFAITETIRAFHAWNDLVNELSSAERELFLNWFGSGVSTTFNLPGISDNRGSITLFQGVHNPNGISLMSEWESNGLVGLWEMTASDNEDDPIRGIINDAANIKTNRTFRDLDGEVRDDILMLLNGDFSLLGDSRFEAERFQDAINHINEILRLDSTPGRQPVIEYWRFLVRNHGSE